MGYNKCCIPGCSTKYGHDLILRIFPTDSILKTKWRQNLGNIRISQSSAVCELHFAQSEFEKIREDGKKKLKQNAVPSLSEEVRCHLSRLSLCIESDHSYNKLLPACCVKLYQKYC
ncbi:uncharacterized protein LOC112466350 isoform X2 [Temnothorax curvispinosus]|uniref:Uncharacterized protein LOC112466350 isoform X2 n=1 Tax=Temnothorax curvispinosus TaxID=300111 RepID=A0A6J1RB92_9HYME|nr:uncharacterized protein LOC112466350 isoform X2 [Temnothorax curvispinosus]